MYIRPRAQSEEIALIYVHLCLVHCCISTKLPNCSLHQIHAVVFLASKCLLQELQGTPQRYVQLLLASTSGAKQQPVPDFHQQLMQAQSASSPHACMPHDTDMPAAASHMDACAEPSTPEIQEWHVRFASQCEHHMLPFHGMARIIIVHSSHSQKLTLEQVKALILSYSHRLQIQERLTNQLADAIQVVTGAVGCVITCEAAHMCMVARGVEKHASSTITLASRGLAAQDSVMRKKLLLRLSQKRIQV